MHLLSPPLASVSPLAWEPFVAFSLAAAVGRAPLRMLPGRNRAARYVRARRLAFHLAHVGLGVSLTRAAAALSRNRAAARRACARTEDGRDAPGWDRALDGLERALRLWCESLRAELAACAAVGGVR
jgi:hypothetical protein